LRGQTEKAPHYNHAQRRQEPLSHHPSATVQSLTGINAEGGGDS
jgi:hypothetical protein